MADTINFMILGFVVIFVAIGIHLWSLVSRMNQLKRDLALLEDLDE
jgi:CcmD family protein